MKRKILSILLVLSMLVGMFSLMSLQISAADTIEIASVDDWMDKVNGKEDLGDATINVTANELDFAGKTLAPVKNFSGTLNGNGVVIRNVTMTGSADVGLFCTSSGNYNDIVITKSSFTADTEWVGSLLCCTNNTTNIKGVYVSGSVKVTASPNDTAKSAYAGGIVGGMGASNYTLSITDCVFAGTVTAAKKYSGGIIGHASKDGGNFVLEIKNSMVLGMVDGKSPSSGFVGYSKYSTVTLENCLYAGGDEGDYFKSYPFTRDTGTLNITNCYTTHVCSDDTVHTSGDNATKGIKYTESGSGVTYLNASEERYTEGDNKGKFKDADFDPRAVLIGENAVQITGFTRRADDVMVPTGVIEFAPPILNATYTVTWANYDGTPIATEEYEGGEKPSYKGENPTRPSDDTYDYTFSGWSPTLSAVLDDITYTAKYYGTRKGVTVKDDKDDKTDGADTQAPATTEAPADSETVAGGGCGSVIGGGAVAIVAVIGSAVVLGRKRKED